MISKFPFAGHLLMSLLLAAECNSAAADERGLHLIAMAKAASGGAAWDRLEIMHDAGKAIRENGVTFRYEHWSDLRTLSGRAHSRAGDMIFDGRVAYECQTVTCDSMTKLDSGEIGAAAYVNAFGFFFPSRFPASFRYKETRVDGGTLYDIVEVSPTNLEALDLWVNHHSHLISRAAFAHGQSVRFSDYRKVSGVMVSFTQVSEGVTLKSETVKFEAVGAVSFSLPPGHAP
jgi:hypothetical protein